MVGHVAELESAHAARHRARDGRHGPETPIGGAQAVGPVKTVVGQGVDKGCEADVFSPFSA